MSPQFTDDDIGKTVVNEHGDEVGIVADVEHGTAHVEPDPGITDTIKAKLGWGGSDEGTYPLQEESVASVTNDEVRLESDLGGAGTGTTAGAGTDTGTDRDRGTDIGDDDDGLISDDDDDGLISDDDDDELIGDDDSGRRSDDDDELIGDDDSGRRSDDDDELIGDDDDDDLIGDNDTR